MIENDVLVRQRYAGGQKVVDGPHNSGRFEVAFWIVVLSNHQNSRMVTLGFQNKLMEILEVLVISG